MVRDLGDRALPGRHAHDLLGHHVRRALRARCTAATSASPRAAASSPPPRRPEPTWASTSPSSPCSCWPSLFAALSRVASGCSAPQRATVGQARALRVRHRPGRETPERFPVRFFLVAMIFIVFDIEIIFLYPWAVIYRELGVFGLVEILRLRGRGLRVVRVPASPTAPSTGARLKRMRRLSADGHRPSAPRDHGPARRPKVGLDGRAAARGGRPDGLGRRATASRASTTTSSPASSRTSSSGPARMSLAGHVRPGLLRHRDDGHRRRRTTTWPASAWRSSGPRPARPTS